MATLAAPLTDDPTTRAAAWLTAYRAQMTHGDVLLGAADEGAWTAMFEELATVAGGELSAARDRVRRHAEDIGTGFRIAGDAEERPWPLSPVPLLIDEDEWATIAAGVAQRAELIETILADIYGAGTLVERGLIPAALVAGSPGFLRPMVGVEPPGGKHLRFIAVDLGRGPTGEWRVLGDHLRAPAGAGYALENRLAISRAMAALQRRLNVQRHAGFFAAFREGLAAACQRVEPRIGLLTPGKFNPSYAEQAHLARYLGMLLVEGADLAALDNRLYVRTIAGLKRIDAVWNRLPPRLIDPLAFDSHSRIGVPGLIDAMATGQVVVANMPGAGVLEAPAFLAFLPALATRLTGRDLILPNLATWWCGHARERDQVAAELDRLLIGPAFGVRPMGLDGTQPVPGATIQGEARERLLADLHRRPQDYVGQEIVAAFDHAGGHRRRAGAAPLHAAGLRRARRCRRVGGAARRPRPDR